VLTARGRCGGPLQRGEGNSRRDGVWVAPAIVAVSSGAAHLGDCTVCPIAELEAEAHEVRPVLEAYRSVRRLNAQPPPAMVQALLVVDEEVERLRAKEAERAKMS
jgi:hypothetical protein